MNIENIGLKENKNLINHQKIVKEKDPRVHQKINKNQACDNCFQLKPSCICKKVSTFDSKLIE